MKWTAASFVLVAAVSLLSLTVSEKALAGVPPGFDKRVETSPANDGGAIGVAENGRPGGGGGPGTGGPSGSGSGPAPAAAPTLTGCSDHNLAIDAFIRGIRDSGSKLFGGLGNADTTTDAPIAWRRCTRIADGGDVGFLTGLGAAPTAPTAPTAPPVPTTDILVASARSQLALDLPDIATSPPRGGEQLVGIPVWFWVENATPVTTTAGIPGLSATLTAEPSDTRIAISGGPDQADADRVTIDCPGPGTPWEAGRYADRASSDCSHPFDWNGTFTIDATVDWALSWTATNGEAGSLPLVSRTTTFTLTIEEAQAVTD